MDKQNGINMESLTDAVNNLLSRMAEEEKKQFWRGIYGPPARRLSGEEYNHILLQLTLSVPEESSNSQRYFTDTYKMGGKTYKVVYGVEENPIIDEYEEIMGNEKAAQLKDAKSEKMKEMRASQPLLTCVYCGYSGKVSNMKRWHFDNCKENNKC